MGTSMDFHPRRGMEKRRCKSETELTLTARESNAVFEQDEPKMATPSTLLHGHIALAILSLPETSIFFKYAHTKKF